MFLLSFKLPVGECLHLTIHERVVQLVQIFWYLLVFKTLCNLDQKSWSCFVFWTLYDLVPSTHISVGLQKGCRGDTLIQCLGDSMYVGSTKIWTYYRDSSCWARLPSSGRSKDDLKETGHLQTDLLNPTHCWFQVCPAKRG